MTEREKQIEVMARDILDAGIALDGTDFAYGITGDDHFNRLANKLYAVGYRKADEVRKETAREIYEYLYEKAQLGESEGLSIADIKYYAGEYGVEMEES